MTEHTPRWLVTLTPDSRQSFNRPTTKMRRMMRPRWPRDLDATARLTRGQAEEKIGRSETLGPMVERVRLPLVTRPDTAGQARGQFPTLFSQFALAISTATITAFLIFWTFTAAWTHGPSSRTAEGYSTEPRLIDLTQDGAAPVGTDTTAP